MAARQYSSGPAEPGGTVGIFGSSFNLIPSGGADYAPTPAPGSWPRASIQLRACGTREGRETFAQFLAVQLTLFQAGGGQIVPST